MNNNINASNAILEPTNPPGGQSNYGNSGGVAIVTESETSSSVDWRRIVLAILWLLALIMLFVVILSYAKRRYRQAVGATAAAATTTTVMTARKSNDEENQATVPVPTDTMGEREQRQPTGILPLLAILIGLALSVSAQTSCEFIIAWEGIPLVRDIDNREVSLSSFGLWSAAIYDGTYGSDHICQSTFRNGFPVDGKLVFGRVSAILASVLGSISLIISVCYLILVATSNLKSMLGYYRISWLLFVATLAQAMVLVVLSTDLCQLENDACGLGIGAVSSITASLYWFIAALSISCL